jgi:H+/gluconate symporter-like permease
LGIAILLISFFSPNWQLQAALFIASIGIICTGVILWGQVEDRKQEAAKLQQIMEKLEKIEQELEKAEQEKSKGSGVAIADILGAGIKYYTEHMAQPKEEEEKDD